MGETSEVRPLLERALDDLAEHPDSSAREIGRRIGIDSRRVFAVLDRAAYDGRCQRWMRAGASVWLWEVPPCPNEPHDHG
jgi:hypothetical protein